jgi:hypothetical protein
LKRLLAAGLLGLSLLTGLAHGREAQRLSADEAFAFFKKEESDTFDGAGAEHIGSSWQRRSNAILSSYRKYFATGVGLDTAADRRAWLGAGLLAGFYTNDPAVSLDIQESYRLLLSRNELDAALASDVVAYWNGLARFDEARRVYDDAVRAGVGEGLPEPPIVTNPATAGSVLSVNQDGRSLSVLDQSIVDSARLIVISSPSCAWSRRAAADLSKDPDLREAFRTHGLFLQPQQPFLGYSRLQSWNRQYPDLPIHVMKRREDFSAMASFATPTFYLVVDGTLVGSHSGWGGEAPAEALRKWMQARGLMRAD